MEYIQQEINKHKNKLMSLINNLINTQLINEEIFINNEIKKESDCLISLLNVKQNTLMNQMNQNNNMNFNPLMPQFNPMLMNAPAININQTQPEIVLNNPFNNKDYYEILFQKDITGKVTVLHCNSKEIISDVIKRYREKAKDYDENRFTFNNMKLNPSLTLFESKIFKGSKILVITQGVVKGGNAYIYLKKEL